MLFEQQQQSRVLKPKRVMEYSQTMSSRTSQKQAVNAPFPSNKRT